jgi:hypothetical protein
MAWWTEYDGLVDGSGIEWIVGWSVIVIVLCRRQDLRVPQLS